MSDYIKAEISLDEVTHGMAYEFLDILRDIRDRMPECPVEEPAIEAPGLILTTEIAKLRAKVNRLREERDKAQDERDRDVREYHARAEQAESRERKLRAVLKAFPIRHNQNTHDNLIDWWFNIGGPALAEQKSE